MLAHRIAALVGLCMSLASMRGFAVELKVFDERLSVELFAEHPEIVTPTGLAVARDGRVFVAESHTHFRPEGYDGPPADRILVFSDTDSDGKADKRDVFHEGFVHIMDVDFCADGSLYVATRRDIHRLRDTDKDGRADESTRIVRLETKGDYPHNGLSGIAFDFGGGFHFGLGENLGEPYTLIGSDGVRISGGGEGGSTYHVQLDGSRLRRMTTGWWNPYGMCTDSFGRVFGTDNDPDSSPPCRLIQVVADGDYGYEFRYGRSGRNPLITWDGEIPGTLPMIAGTGEAPCHIVAYESDALPAQYFGALLVPSWADHRVEFYPLTQQANRGLVETKRQTLVEGPDDFRPVGIDVAPDGTIYVSDWVSSSYQLHKLGRVWRIRPKNLLPRKESGTPTDRLTSRDRPTRELAAQELVKTDAGRSELRNTLQNAETSQARATALDALSRSGDTKAADQIVADERAPIELRVLAANYCSPTIRSGNSQIPTPVRATMLQRMKPTTDELSSLLKSNDPWLQHAAIGTLARLIADKPSNLASLATADDTSFPQLPVLLAVKRTKSFLDPEEAVQLNTRYLKSKDPNLRFMAVKWASDELLKPVRPHLDELLGAEDLDFRTFLALNVAIDRLDGKKLTDRPPAERLVAKLSDDNAPLAIRRLCLRLMDPNAAKLRLDSLEKLLKHSDEGLVIEAIRAISRHADAQRFEILQQVARDTKRPVAIRTEAVLGLSQNAQPYADVLVNLLLSDSPAGADGVGALTSFHGEILRALVGVKLTEDQKEMLRQLSQKRLVEAEAVARVVDQQLPNRPVAQDGAAWSKLVAGHGDPVAGERIFFGTSVGKCSTCHQVEGLGASVGPDLSQMSRRVASAGQDGQRWLLETVLQPSRDMAPQFTPWQVVTKDGKQYLGLPLRKGGNSEAYLGTDGLEFSLKNHEIESRHEATVSIMPENLLQQLTRQELADLFAFLTKPR